MRTAFRVNNNRNKCWRLGLSCSARVFFLVILSRTIFDPGQLEIDSEAPLPPIGWIVH